jgi:hypothetical protein
MGTAPRELMINANLSAPGKAAIAVLLGAVLLIALSQTGASGSKLTASWSYDYGPLLACSTAQARNCIDHFEVQDITNADKIRVLSVVSNPSPAAGKVDRISTSFKYRPPFGTRTISVVAVARDAQGKTITSNPYACRVTVSIRPGAKTSLAF